MREFVKALQYGEVHPSVHKGRVVEVRDEAKDNAGPYPRHGLGYDFSLGDSNPRDGKNQTFENPFGTIHRYFGAMDLFLRAQHAGCPPLRFDQTNQAAHLVNRVSNA